MTPSAKVMGTASATVIQSSPSMKFTRLTNHSVPINSKMRSLHHGSIGSKRNSDGNVASTAATAQLCSTSRGAAAIGRLSARAPMAAIRSTAAEITTSDDVFVLGREKNKV